MRRYLIVANQTLTEAHLIAKVRELDRGGPCAFHVVVPATVPQDHPWTEGEVQGTARHRLEEGLALFRDAGVEATGQVGDADPVLAVEDVLREQAFDGIVISTLHPRISRWLKLDLPRRVEGLFGLPVIHVEGEEQPATPR
jgi:cell pole-organizing protein PopZ